MVTIKQKTKVPMKISAVGETHARSVLKVRDVTEVIDEPIERGGTNMGATPTETLMTSLIGCTNVITQRIAHHMGVKTGLMEVELNCIMDRRGVWLQEEVDVPFEDVVMDITLETDATAEQMEQIKTDLSKFCPIEKVIGGAGTKITKNWTVKPL
ncbi:MAG: OsmC family protein [Pseudomonadota bacterium]